MATPDRGLRDKALNIINNVGQYGPLDATIDSYKQAADYADDARQYAELAASGVENLNTQIARVTEIANQVQDLEEKSEATYTKITTLDVDAVNGPTASAVYDKTANKIHFTLPAGRDGTDGIDGTDGEDGKSAYQSYLDTTLDNPKLSERDWIASLHGKDGINGVDGTNGTDGRSAYELAVIGGYQGTLEDFNNLNTKSLDRNQNLSELTNVPAARANLDVNSRSEVQTMVDAKAGKGINSDITSLTGLTTALTVAQGGTGAKDSTAARTNLSAAKSGDNNDITKLSGLVAGGGVSLGEINLSTGAGEKGVNLASDSTIGISFGTEATNGGASVFHNFCKGPGGSAIKDGALIGGYGSRPWDGSQYTGHSNSCIHFLQDGDTTSTNHAGWLRLLVTPSGKTIDSRYSPFILSNNGDTMIGKDLPYGAYKGSLISSNFSQYDGRGLKQFVNNANEVQLISGITSGVSNSGNFRISLCGGSPLNPGPTQVDSSAFFTLSGFDGTYWTAAQAAIQLRTVESWTTNSSACEIILATTPSGGRSRLNRWIVQNDGHFCPVDDNTLSIGYSQKRLTAVYAVNGTIQTSDARLKSEVRPFTDDEIKASKLLAKEIGFFSWLAKQETEGDKAREHVGMTVQKAIEIMESCNLDPLHYGFICHDTWDETQEVVGYENGDSDKPIVKTIPAGDRYSFRYDQLNLFIAKGFEARLSALEAE